MGESCSIFGKCRNRQTGQMTNKTSQLHKDLLSIGKLIPSFNRKKANRAFFLSQTDKFLKDFDEELIFDSDAVDAEPILASFYEAARTIMPEVKASDIREILAKKFGEGVYSYEDAYQKMLDFNKQMQGAHTFIGTIEFTEGGKYKFRIAFNAIEEQQALLKTIANREAAQTLLTQLEKSGVTASEGQKSLYSTLDPVTILNGSKELLKLIEVKGGIENIHDFAKETGHFVVGALGESNPLYQRLWGAVKAHPEMMRELLGEDEYIQYSKTPNETIEFMGHLVGKYLEELSSKKDKNFFSTFKRLLSRAIEYVKTKLPFTNREYNKAVYDAKYIAYNMAKSFLGDNFEGSLTTALERKESLEGNLNSLLGILNNQIRQVHLLLEKTKGINYKITKNYKDMFNELVTALQEFTTQNKENKDFSAQLETNEAAVNTLLNLARFMTNEMSQATSLLKQCNKGIINGKIITMQEQANVIKYNQEVYKMCKQLISTQQALINSMWKETTQGDQSDLVKDVQDVYSLLQEITTGFKEVSNPGALDEHSYYTSYEEAITAARRNLAAKLLTQINGSQFLAVIQHTGINNFKLERYKSKVRNLADEILKTDINPPGQWISRWIDSMADNPDIVNQLIYDVVEQKKHEANKKTLDMKDRLVEKYRELKRLGISDTRLFYETDSEGHLTGNLISERNWGQWEKEYKDAMKEFNDQYWEANKAMFNGNKSEMLHNNMYLVAFGAWRNGWHKEHSVKIPVLDKDGKPKRNEDGMEIKILAPAISSDKDSIDKVTYDSKQYQDFINKYGHTSAQVQWLKDFINLKKELDELLPFGATNMSGVRAPQFMGTTINRFSNAVRGEGKVTRVFGIPLRKYIINAVTKSPDDIEFGGEHDTYDKPDINEDTSVIFDQDHINALNQINRLPMYGVKKLPKIDDLSTDLISSTLAYASMAYSYGCLSEVVESIEQIYQLKGGQKVKSDIPIKDLKESQQPGNYSRLSSYIMQQVYNNYSDPIVSFRPLRKLGNTLSKFGSFYFLGFNLHSALTNAYTGWNEMVKEALGGDEFTLKDFVYANACYSAYWLRGFLQNVCNIGTASGSDLESHNKMDLFLRMFDVQNENERKFRDWNIGAKGYGLTKGRSIMNLAMLPYSMTDHWMQSIAFMASARHTELLNKATGKTSTLWDAYIIKDGVLSLKGNPSDWFIKDKNLEALQNILQKKDFKELSTDERRAIYQTDDFGDLIYDDNHNPILKDAYIPFNYQQENRFRTRCRAINNRMHGVYNRGDGGAYLGLALGGPIASLKKYAIGLIDRRFSRARYDFRTRDIRQGSYVTMCNLVWDCFSIYGIDQELEEDKPLGVLGEISSKLDKMSYLGNSDSTLANIPLTAVQTIGKILWGIAKISYIGSTGGWLSKQYLRDRGFSDIQIANIGKCWGDIMIPFMLQLLMAICAPPDTDDEDEGFLYDNSIRPLRHLLGFDSKEPSWFSDMMTTMYLGALNMLPGDKTTNDEKYLNKKVFTKNITKRHGAPPFSFQSILYYQTYRAYLEQIAYNPIYPRGILNEFKSLTSSALPAATALGDVGVMISQLSEGIGLTAKSKEDLKEMRKDDKNVFKKYKNGKEIYQKGNNAHWYKWARHFLKVGPLRTGAMWEDGYTSKESMEYFRGGAGAPIWEWFGWDADSKANKRN